MRDLLGRVVAPEVAEELLSKEIQLGGEERTVTVLFADVRGFTPLSEREDPQRLVRALNSFLTGVSRAVEKHGGVVEEYLGDGAKALFGAPVSHADDAERAVRAGLALARSMSDVNAAIAEWGVAPLAIGIGDATGRSSSTSRWSICASWARRRSTRGSRRCGGSRRPPTGTAPGRTSRSDSGQWRRIRPSPNTRPSPVRSTTR